MLKKENNYLHNVAYFALGFVLPAAGFVIWSVAKDRAPRLAVPSGMGALFGTLAMIGALLVLEVIL